MSLSLSNLSGFGAYKPTGNDANTVLLLHMDGGDGSTTFTDTAAGATAHTFTANGTAQIDTAENKFGGSSAVFDGSSWIDTPDSADWDMGSGDWTVECWFNRSAGFGTSGRLLGQVNSAGTAYTFILDVSSANVLRIQCFHAANQNMSGTTTITAAGWHHAAAVRTGNTVKLFLDGVQEGSNLTVSGAMQASTNKLSVGRGGEQNAALFTGWIDEVRISKGVARWTANFTPPTRAYG